VFLNTTARGLVLARGMIIKRAATRKVREYACTIDRLKNAHFDAGPSSIRRLMDSEAILIV